MRSSPSRRRAGRAAVTLVLPIALTFSALPVLAAPSPSPVSTVPEHRTGAGADGVALLRVVVPDEAALERLNAMGIDLAEYKKPLDQGIEVHAVLSPREAADLRALGFDVRGPIGDPSDAAANTAERQSALKSADAAEQASDTLTPLRAEWFTSLDDQRFLSVEVKSSATDAETVLTATWDSGPHTDPGSGGTATMSRFTDAGQYMYHRFNVPLNVAVTPATVTVTSNRGGSVTVPVTKWLGERRKPPGRHYVADFVDRYRGRCDEATPSVVDRSSPVPQSRGRNP